MVAIVSTVAYLGLEARAVEVQVQLSTGIPRFVIVGLPDKAVAESRERVRAALTAIGLALPPKVITVNLSPADLPKEGVLSTGRLLLLEPIIFEKTAPFH
jgi:magnesium chelatase family protein